MAQAGSGARRIEINGKVFSSYPESEIHNHFGYIYVTTDNSNNKRYVGLSYSKKNDSKYLGSGRYLKSAMAKHGRESFTKVIIDFAESLEELEDLEVWYIQKAFGENVAKSSNWYNITDGRQRGGNSWAGYTDRDYQNRLTKARLTREKNGSNEVPLERRQRMSLITSKRFESPDERERTSKATKAGMNNANVVLKMKGRKHVISEPERAKLVERSKRMGKKNFHHLGSYRAEHGVWNAGRNLSDSERYQIADRDRRIYKIYTDDIEVYVSVTRETDLAVALKMLKISSAGKTEIHKIISSDENVQNSRLHIERVRNSDNMPILVFPSGLTERFPETLSGEPRYNYSLVVDGTLHTGSWVTSLGMRTDFETIFGKEITRDALSKLLRRGRDMSEFAYNKHNVKNMEVIPL